MGRELEELDGERVCDVLAGVLLERFSSGLVLAGSSNAWVSSGNRSNGRGGRTAQQARASRQGRPCRGIR